MGNNQVFNVQLLLRQHRIMTFCSWKEVNASPFPVVADSLFEQEIGTFSFTVLAIMDMVSIKPDWRPVDVEIWLFFVTSKTGLDGI